MSSGLWEEWAQGLPLGSNGPNSQALWGALARVIGDFAVADGIAGVLESLPGYASPNANALTANDRQLERGPAETDAGFAARLVAAPAQWKLAGSALGLLVQLYYSGFGRPLLAQQNGLVFGLTSAPVLGDLAPFNVAAVANWYQVSVRPPSNPAIPASMDGKSPIAPNTIPWTAMPGGPMDSEGNQFCSRFVLVFDGQPAGASLAVAANLDRLRRVIAEWNALKALCAAIFVRISGIVYGGGWRYGDGSVYGGSVITYGA